MKPSFDGVNICIFFLKNNSKIVFFFFLKTTCVTFWVSSERVIVFGCLRISGLPKVLWLEKSIALSVLSVTNQVASKNSRCLFFRNYWKLFLHKKKFEKIHVLVFLQIKTRQGRIHVLKYSPSRSILTSARKIRTEFLDLESFKRMTTNF